MLIYKLNERRKYYEEQSEQAVTHKLSTTTISDCVYVLKKGKIIAHGKHEKLMQNNRYYSDFFR